MKMNHYARCVTAGIVCTLMYGNLFAQETFDLSSQRSEKQDVRAVPGEKVDHKGAVPGEKVDHKGFVLNPQPHQFTPIAGKTCDISQGVSLKDKQQKFSAYLDFLSQHKKGTRLTIDFGAKAARKAHVKEVSGALRSESGQESPRERSIRCICPRRQ